MVFNSCNGGHWRFVVAAIGFLILWQDKQCWASNQQNENQKNPGYELSVKDPPNAQSGKGQQQRCYPGGEVGVSCDGVAAKAAVDQATDADKQTTLGNWQLGMSAGAAVAAIFAAAFAWKASAHAKSTYTEARHSNRAWMSYVAPQLAVSLDDNGGIAYIDARLLWRNVAQTPATQSTVRYAIIVAPTDVDVNELRAHIDEQQIGSGHPSPVGPNIDTFSGVMKLLPGHMYTMVAHAGRLFLWSEIKYRDIFEPDKERLSEACIELAFKENVTLMTGKQQAERIQSYVIGPLNRMT